MSFKELIKSDSINTILNSDELAEEITYTPLRDTWEKEKPLYDALGKFVEAILAKEVQKVGIYAVVTHRSKDLDTLLKKALRKQCNYTEITDKLGLRAILYFRKHLPSVDQIIQSAFYIR